MGRKLCLAIGVGDAPPLDYLRGAINGAHAMHDWATANGYDSRLLTDEKTAIGVADIKAELESLLAGAEDEARSKIGSLQEEIEGEQRKLNAAKAATADFLRRTRELCEAQIALIERAPDLTPEEIAGTDEPKQHAAADVNAIEEKILASFRSEGEQAEGAEAAAEESAPAAESAPQTDEPEKLEPDDSPFVETANHAIRLDDLQFGRNYRREE